MKPIIKLDPEMSVESRALVLKSFLSEFDGEVMFTKVDGSVRVMPCTLREAVIPKVDKVLVEGEEKKAKKHNPDVMSVFCLDKQEWRSFRLMNVIEFKEYKNE